MTGKAINKVPGMALAAKDKYVENLSTYTIVQLDEIRDRQEKLMEKKYVPTFAELAFHVPCLELNSIIWLQITIGQIAGSRRAHHQIPRTNCERDKQS